MHTAARFGQENADGEADFPPEVAGQYAGDATIFEVTCYTFSRVEARLAIRQATDEKTAADRLAFWVAEIFAVAWHQSEEQVGRLLAERLDAYRACAKAGGERAVRDEAIRRVLATRGDSFAKAAHREVAEGDRLFVNYSLGLYEKSQLPELTTAVEDFRAEEQTKAQPTRPAAQDGQEVRDYRLAMALLAQKDFIRARSAFSKVLETNPRNYDALLQRGRVQVALSQPVEAIDDFSRAIAVNANDSRAYLERGLCYHRVLRQADSALADYDKAIGLAPDNPAAQLARGSLFDEVDLTIERQAAEDGEPGKQAEISSEFLAAVNGYSRAIVLAPDFDEAYVSRGLAYARKARAGSGAEYAAKAVADLEKAMELNWENGYLYKTVDELKAQFTKRQPANV